MPEANGVAADSVAAAATLMVAAIAGVEDCLVDIDSVSGGVLLSVTVVAAEVVAALVADPRACEIGG